MISEEELKRIEAGEPMDDGVVTYLVGEVRDLKMRLETTRQTVDLYLAKISKLQSEVVGLRAKEEVLVKALVRDQEGRIKNG